jgi:hypothetical protein
MRIAIRAACSGMGSRLSGKTASDVPSISIEQNPAFSRGRHARHQRFSTVIVSKSVSEGRVTGRRRVR